MADSKFLDMLECAGVDYSDFVEAFTIEIKPVKDISQDYWCQEREQGCMAAYQYEDSTVVVNLKGKAVNELREGR